MARKPSKALVRRPIAALHGYDDRDPLSPCPSCGRVTRTVGHGSCVDCWNPKAPDGAPVIRGKPPRTEPLGLLDWLDDVPDILWLFALIGILAGFVGIAAWLIA
jgi:hypothetical protein